VPPSRAEAAPANIIVDPSDEELARDLTLSITDLEEAGEPHRKRFAVQRCALRTLGGFVGDLGEVPARIANHIGRQLGLPPSLFLDEFIRSLRPTSSEACSF
jgi:hypothetical protein